MGTLNERTLVWAHRGASAYAPENTLAAFALAIEMDADGIELDVHQTADGVVVVCHDESINRTSNGEGEIEKMTLAQLEKFSFYGKFADKYPICKIPTLKEVYELIKPSRLTINVEIKASGTDFVKAVCAVTEECGMKDRVIYSSFTHKNLTDALVFVPDAQVAPLYDTGLADAAVYSKNLGASAVHPSFRELFAVEGYVEKAHELGIRVHPWTVDDEATIDKLVGMGADAVITNKPDVALRFVR